MIKVICDRCGREVQVPGRIGYLAWNFRNGHGGDLVGNNVLENRDYCEICMATIFDFIDRPSGQDGAGGGRDGAADDTESGTFDLQGKESIPEDGTSASGTAPGEVQSPGHPADSPGSSTVTERHTGQQAGGKSRKNSVDIGKILALRDTGWSFGKIADDMGLSKQSVCNAYSRWKRAQEGESPK